jgi:hypothetical protein
VPIDRDSDSARAKRDAELAHLYFNRLIGKGHSRAEAIQLTGAWILSRRVELPDEERQPWERE